MKTIYFVRHAQCQANAERLIAGSRNDSPLTMLGKQQADETGESLTGLKVDLIVCSPLSRAKDTALRIAEKIGYKGEIRTEPLLIERDFGSVTGTPDTKGFAAIDAGEVEDVEKLEDFAARMHQALEMFEALPGKVILAGGYTT